MGLEQVLEVAWSGFRRTCPGLHDDGGDDDAGEVKVSVCQLLSPLIWSPALDVLGTDASWEIPGDGGSPAGGGTTRTGGGVEEGGAEKKKKVVH